MNNYFNNKIKVPFLDIYSINKEFTNEFSSDLIRVLNSGSLILSSEVETFEEEFANYCGTRYCIGVANGLQALEIIMRSWVLEKATKLSFHQILI